MRAGVFVAGVVLATTWLSATDVVSPKLADACEKKVVLVQSQAGKPAPKPRATPFAENELNSYLRYKATDQLPTGLTEPMLTLYGEGRVMGKAVVDLDIVRQKKSSGSLFDPTSYLAGKLQVTAVGKVKTGDGKGRFELERAEIAGFPMPKSLMGTLVNFFTRTAANPQGSSIDDTFELPSDIRRIDVDKGQATVIQ
jgi:hypothetical protein